MKQTSGRTAGGGPTHINEALGGQGWADDGRGARNAPGRWALCAAALWAGLIVYGSLLPFHIDVSQLAASGFGLHSIGFREAGVEDVVVNLLLYAPFGLLLNRWLWGERGRGFGQVFRVGCIVLAATLLSTLVEIVQTAIPSRVGSWTDVALNGVGALAGALAARRVGVVLGHFVRRAAVGLLLHPFQTAGFGLTLGLFVYQLAPFDFISTTEGLHASFARSRFWVAGVYGSSAGGSLSSGAVASLQVVGWFALLGYVLALGARESGRRSGEALAYALKHGIGLAGLIECMQLFTGSHVFEPPSIVIHGVGVFAGSWAALFLSDLGRKRQQPIRRLAEIPTSHLAFAVAFQSTLLLLPTWIEVFSTEAVSTSKTAALTIPLESLWRAPASFAAMEIASKIVLCGSLVISMGMLLRKSNRRGNPVSLAWWVVMTLVMLSEGLRFGMGGHCPDWVMLLSAAGSGLVLSGLVERKA